MGSGVHATFMPKPIEGVQGSGMHTHLSLWKGDTNAFYDPDDEFGLSGTAKGFIAGLLHHASEITAVTNQLVNSYKRLVAGFEAPVHISWARQQPLGAGPGPGPQAGQGGPGPRIEYRSLDPAVNPYLAWSVILAAGMRGVTGLRAATEAAVNLRHLGGRATHLRRRAAADQPVRGARRDGGLRAGA